MIILTIILIVVTSFLSSIYWFQTRSRFALLFNRFPQVTPFLPVMGYCPRVSRKPASIYAHYREVLGRYQETFGAWAGSYGTLHIVTAEDAEIILSNIKYIDKGFNYEMIHSWLGTGLLTSTETSMGIKFDESDKKAENYHTSLYNFTEIVVERMFSPWLYPDMIYHLFPMAWKEKKMVKFLHKYTTGVIKAREEQYVNEDVLDLDSKSNDAPSKKRLAMLDLLISAKRERQEIDDEGIRQEVDTFVFEGHDTTFVGITFALLMLANHKNVQEKVIAELDEIIGNSDRHATYEDLQNMKYLECCLKESLRLYPSVPLIGRNIKEDMTLTHHVAPAGAHAFVHIYNVHRDPRHFPDPEKYDPDRFLPKNSIGRHPFAYIPFSAGPRNCIGQKFAMLELKSVVSAILRNFRMEPVDSPKDLKFVSDLVLRVKGPMYIKFIPRIQFN